MTSTIELARRLHRAIETGRSGDDLRDHFTDDVVTVEHPNLVTPAGRTTGLTAMLEGSRRGADLLASQRYDELDARDLGDLAVIRLRWTGVVAVDAGPFSAGQKLVAHIAQFVTARDGRICRIETYDCYEPVSTSRPAP